MNLVLQLNKAIIETQTRIDQADYRFARSQSKLSEIKTKTSTHDTFEKGRTASILVNGKTIGVMGEINSKSIENYKIRVPVVGFEIHLSGLIFD